MGLHDQRKEPWGCMTRERDHEAAWQGKEVVRLHDQRKKPWGCMTRERSHETAWLWKGVMRLHNHGHDAAWSVTKGAGWLSNSIQWNCMCVYMHMRGQPCSHIPIVKLAFHTSGPCMLLCEAYQQSVSTGITHTYCFQTLEGIHYLEEVDF